jgi:hypothetical protein
MSGPTDDTARTDGGGATRGTRDTSGGDVDPEPVEPEPTPESGPNLAAFLLTAGGVTAVFIAIFVFAFPEPINQYFAGIVLGVTVITLIVGMVLDLLGYFGDEAKVGVPDEDGSSEPAQLESVRKRPNKPLPKQINFDDEIRQLRDHFDGDLPEQMDAFLTEYEKLKSSSQNRKVVAGSLRAALNPIAALVTDEAAEEMVDEMGDRLFAYIKADPVDNMVVTEHAFYTDGVQTPDRPQQRRLREGGGRRPVQKRGRRPGEDRLPPRRGGGDRGAKRAEHKRLRPVAGDRGRRVRRSRDTRHACPRHVSRQESTPSALRAVTRRSSSAPAPLRLLGRTAGAPVVRRRVAPGRDRSSSASGRASAPARHRSCVARRSRRPCRRDW